MRLTCPNCDAQYEVPDEVVPQAGRDVQCSNCGNTWYQYHPDNPPEEDRETDPTVPDADEEIAAPPAPPEPEPSAAVQPSRRELDPAVADILKQEAEAEEAARAAMRASEDMLESQPDLGLDSAEPSSDETRRAEEAATRMARIRGEDPIDHSSDVAAAALGSRKDLLPDIDEINSTLRSSGEASSASGEMEVEAPTHQRKKRGFRFGFTLMLLLFVVALLLYIFAPAIVNAVPALEETMASYVAAVDSFRAWIDGLVRGGLSWLDSTASNAPSDS